MNKGEIRVSVLCDVYNHAPYLRQCLDGFVMQKTDFKFEVLVHDDASTDMSPEIILEYTNKYPDIFKTIIQKENQYSKGVRIWFKYQFPRVEGKYIAMCEGDDYWIDPYKLQKQVDFLESHPDYGVCITDFDKKLENQGRIEHEMFKTQPWQYRAEYKDAGDFIVHRGYVAPPTWLFRKDLYQSYPTSIESVDGTFVWFAFFLAKTKVHYIPDATAVYRVLSESASHSASYEKMYYREKNILQTQYKLIDFFGLDPSLKDKCLDNYYRYNLLSFALYGKVEDLKAARKYINNDILLKNKIILFFAQFEWGRKLLLRLKRYRDNR